MHSPLVKRIPPVLCQSLDHILIQLRPLLVLSAQRPHQIQSAYLFLAEQPQPGMRPFIDPVRLRTHKRRTDNHSFADKDDLEAKMVSEERESPWSRQRGLTEEPKVVRMFIEDRLAVDELAQEGVGERAAVGLFVSRGRQRGFQDAVNEFLRLCVRFVETDTAYRGMSGETNSLRMVCIPGFT